jgi:cytochrome c5
MGTPVGMTEAMDGSVYIVEDKSRKILQLFYDSSKGDGRPVKEDLLSSGTVTDEETNDILERKIALEERLKKNEVPLFSQVQSKVIDQSCILCHGGKNAPGIQLLQYDDVGNAKRINDLKKASDILNRVSALPNVPMMPPMGFKSDREKNEAMTLLKAWIDAGEPIPK